MPTKELSKITVRRNEVITKLGFDGKKIESLKFESVSNARRAQLLKVPVASLKTPIVLSPASLIKGKSNLELFSSMMVDPTWPSSTGQALFSSAYPGVLFPEVQVAFPRIKTGKMHLVEFNVVLYGNVTYKFRVFEYPLADFQDVSVPGPKAETLLALVPPVDEITGDLELGASIQQRNTVSDNAGWVLHSVVITTTD
jgi:hypothetical protein